MLKFLGALRMFAWMTLLTGVVYPLLVTSIAYLTMREKAEGSIVYGDHGPIGSRLIGQKFEGDHYFWGRPSAVDYNPLNSGGSNLGPTSATLKRIVEERRQAVAKAHGVDPGHVPRDLIFASGSGLDPDITPTSAYFQVDRIAKARGVNNEEGRRKIRDLIADNIERRHMGFLGIPCINVLLLNRALDQMEPAWRK